MLQTKTRKSIFSLAILWVLIIFVVVGDNRYVPPQIRISGGTGPYPMGEFILLGVTPALIVVAILWITASKGGKE